MKRCKWCNLELEDNVEICPNCNLNQYSEESLAEKRKDATKLRRCGEKEDLWRKIFKASVLITLSADIIIYFMVDEKKYILIPEKIVLYSLIAPFVFILFSLLMFLRYHINYEKLIREIYRKNHPNEVITNNYSTNEPTQSVSNTPHINYVLEGKYKNTKLYHPQNTNYLSPIGIGWNFTKKNISSYTLIDENNKEEYSFLKGALGAAFFGGLGVVAGIGGKSRKEYLIAVEWKDGEKSLILIDDKNYKVFVQSMF